MKKLRLIKNNKHVDLSGASLEDLNYQKDIFKRSGFLDSLSSLERDLKED